MTAHDNNNQEWNINEDEVAREFTEAHLRVDDPVIEELVRQYPEYEHQIRQMIKDTQAVDLLLVSLVRVDENNFEVTSSGTDLMGRKIGACEITEMINRGEIPLNVHALLHRCLEKDVHKSLQHISEAHIEINETLSGITSIRTVLEAAAGSVSRKHRLILWLLLCLMMVIVIALSLVLFKN